MPYTPDELIELPSEVLHLIGEIKAALDPKGDGGKKITKAERTKLLKALAHLSFLLLRDGLD
jgi:hypothetical protein